MKIEFMKNKKLWFSISGVIILIGVLAAAIFGFKQDIEFAGGSAMVIEMGKAFDRKAVAEVVANTIGDPKPDVIAIGPEGTQVSIKTTIPLDTTKTRELFEAVKKEFNLEAETYLSNDKIAPVISKEIKTRAVTAVVVATILIAIYIWFRFADYRFSFAAVLALIHDVLVMFTVYAVFKIPLNDAFIAAMLTVIGYSINDTIIVFDRIRENRKYAKRETLDELVDRSVNETLVRSINTSLTTILTISVLYFVGVESIKQFAFPLLIGILSGTYSSVFIAAPSWVLFRQMENKKRKTKTA